MLFDTFQDLVRVIAVGSLADGGLGVIAAEEGGERSAWPAGAVH